MTLKVLSLYKENNVDRRYPAVAHPQQIKLTPDANVQPSFHLILISANAKELSYKREQFNIQT